MELSLILFTASNYKNIPVELVKQKCRKRTFVDIKKAYAIFSIENTDINHADIGRLIGHNHTLISYYYKEKRHKEIQEIVNYLKNELL